MFDRQDDMTLVGQASNGREAIESFRRLRPDVTLMDLRMPDMSGMRGGRSLSSVSGIVVTPQGDLWLSTSEGAIKIAADEARQPAMPRPRRNREVERRAGFVPDAVVVGCGHAERVVAGTEIGEVRRASRTRV